MQSEVVALLERIEQGSQERAVEVAREVALLLREEARLVRQRGSPRQASDPIPLLGACRVEQQQRVGVGPRPQDLSPIHELASHDP